ncbi:hypothetical protein SEA_CHICKENKING_43 [Microbacterium phage ChickenKing]|nr:hypothetical protein SEA_CHICKENKING_43 [Microbacterium phage ChickenKing]QNL30997.1 hypothetical protein SEA_GAECEO_44 [Microbacterium phage GaeCeo]
MFGEYEPLHLPTVQKLHTHTFQLTEEELMAQVGHTSQAVLELIQKLSAEDERMRRILPDPPEGFHWEQDWERCEDYPANSVRFRITYRLKEIN